MSAESHPRRSPRLVPVVVTLALLGAGTALGFLLAGVSVPVVVAVGFGLGLALFYGWSLVTSYRQSRRAGRTRATAVLMTLRDSVDFLLGRPSR
jgi:membrane-associated phospholipid phosphatase